MISIHIVDFHHIPFTSIHIYSIHRILSILPLLSLTCSRIPVKLKKCKVGKSARLINKAKKDPKSQRERTVPVKGWGREWVCSLALNSGVHRSVRSQALRQPNKVVCFFFLLSCYFPGSEGIFLEGKIDYLSNHQLSQPGN